MAILMDSVDRGSFDLGTLARVNLGGAPRQILKSVSDADWGPSDQLALLRMTEDESAQVLEWPAGKALYEVRHPRGRATGSAAPWMQSPRVSPDGRLVAFLEHPQWNEFPGAISVVDRAGRKRVISAGWDVLGGLDWSPGGDELWFAAVGHRPIATGHTDAPGWAIRAVNLSGRERVVLTGPGSLALRDLSREGRLLVSRESFRTTTLYGGQGLERERDLSWSDVSGVVALSADGKTILFSVEDRGAYLRSTDGGPVVRLGEEIPTGLSPDGKWVSTKAVDSEALTLIPTGPGESKRVSLPGLEGVFFPKWFPDSRHLVVSAKRGTEGRRCFLVDFEGGVPRPVTPQGSRAGRGFDCWPSPDGRWVTAGEGDGTLALYPVLSGEPRRVGGLTPKDRMIQWSADGRSLYICALNREWPIRVFRFDLETGKRELWKELVPTDAAGIEEPQGAAIRITPDGKFYALSLGRTLSELYVVDRAR
jgi:Tol biopolymer transport system component